LERPGGGEEVEIEEGGQLSLIIASAAWMDSAVIYLDLCNIIADKQRNVHITSARILE
jgi:hypothetical protein